MGDDPAHVGQDAVKHLIQVERAVEGGGRVAQGFSQGALLALGGLGALAGEKRAQGAGGAAQGLDFGAAPDAHGL
jgi:hypothetical protein